MPPGKVRQHTELLEARWKTKRVQDGAWVKANIGEFLQQRAEPGQPDREFDIELTKMRYQMALTFGQGGLANTWVVPDITASGTDAFLGTPLWPGGPQVCDLPGDACPDLPSTSNDDRYKQRVWDFWLTDYHLDFWLNMVEGDDKAKEPVKGSKGKKLSPGPAPPGLPASSPSGAAGVSSGKGSKGKELSPGPARGQSASSSSGVAGVSSGMSRFLPTSS